MTDKEKIEALVEALESLLDNPDTETPQQYSWKLAHARQALAHLQEPQP